MKSPSSGGREIPSASAEHRDLSPLRLSLIVMLGQVALYATASLALQSGRLFWGMYTVGDDYGQFLYPAAGDWLTKGTPYHGPLFLGPPTALIPVVLLHGFPLATSRAIYTLTTVMLMAFALWRFAGALGLGRRYRVGLLAVAAAFLPMWMLVNGGNLDGLMLAGLLLAYSVRSKMGRALLLAGTIVLKVYSTLLLLVALRKRDLRLAGATAGFCLLALLPFCRLWPEALYRILVRTGSVHVTYNISPAQLFYLAFHRWGALAWMAPYAVGWLGALAYTLWRNADSNGPETLALYAPFMIAAPMVVSSYVGVMALSVFALMLRASQERRLYWHEWLAVTGFLLLDLHPEFVVAYGSYTFAAFSGAKLAGSVAGAIGTTLLVVATVCRARASAEQTPSAASANP